MRDEAMKVLLVDDHPLFLDEAQRTCARARVQVVGCARDGLEALDKARALHPEVILMDIHMPQLDGLAALRLIKAELPNIRIVMLTMSAEDEDLFEAIKSGACGYLLKTQDTDEFFTLLQDVARGEVALSPGLAARILSEFGRQAGAAPGVADKAARQPVPTGDGSPDTRRARADIQRGRRKVVPGRAHDQISHGRDRRAASFGESRAGDLVRQAHRVGQVVG
jgi:DNA-binding NarL/FixJ family response regulator